MLGECPIIKHGVFKLQEGSLEQSVRHQTPGDWGVNFVPGLWLGGAPLWPDPHSICGAASSLSSISNAPNKPKRTHRPRTNIPVAARGQGGVGELGNEVKVVTE